MPSRQLGTLESNDMGERDRQWTTASAGQSQRGGKFTSTHLEALRASCFPRRGWQAQAHTCTEHTNSASRERDAQGSGGAWAGQMTYRARRLVLRPFGGCRGEPPRDGHSSIPGQAAHEKLLLNCPVFDSTFRAFRGALLFGDCWGATVKKLLRRNHLRRRSCQSHRTFHFVPHFISCEDIL